MKITYRSNNSGGSWWLNDNDWSALENAGWYVVWGNKYFCGSGYSWNERPANKPDCGHGKQCHGHRRFDSRDEMTNADRYLGALAVEASKEIDNSNDAVRDAIVEFEKLTGLEASDEGCGCCRPPHCFSWDGGSVDGADVLPILYGDGPKSLRDAYRERFEK